MSILSKMPNQRFSDNRIRAFKECTKKNDSLQERYALSDVPISQKLSDAQLKSLIQYLQDNLDGEETTKDKFLSYDALVLLDAILCRWIRPSELSRLLLISHNHKIRYYRAILVVATFDSKSLGLSTANSMTAKSTTAKSTAKSTRKKSSPYKSPPSKTHYRLDGHDDMDVHNRIFSSFVGYNGMHFYNLTKENGLLYMWLHPDPQGRPEYRALHVYALQKKPIQLALDSLSAHAQASGVTLVDVDSIEVKLVAQVKFADASKDSPKRAKQKWTLVQTFGSPTSAMTRKK